MTICGKGLTGTFTVIIMNLMTCHHHHHHHHHNDQHHLHPFHVQHPLVRSPIPLILFQDICVLYSLHHCKRNILVCRMSRILPTKSRPQAVGQEGKIFLFHVHNVLFLNESIPPLLLLPLIEMHCPPMRDSQKSALMSVIFGNL